MSDEELAEVLDEETAVETDEVVVDEVAAEEIEYSDVEQDAISQGWSPEGAEGKRNLTAEEFLDRKPLYDKMHKMDKRLKEQDRKFDAMQKHEKMVRDRMHGDHLKELKTSKRAAMEEMDYDKVEQLDEEMDKARVEHNKVEEVVVDTQAGIQATLEDWVEDNSWYKSDKVMQRFAEGEGKDFRNDNPNATFDDVLAHISKTVKKEFPEKFQNMNRQKVSSVEGGTTGSRRAPAVSKQKTVKDLPTEAIPVMKTLVRSGTFKTEAAYVKDYFNQ